MLRHQTEGSFQKMCLEFPQFAYDVLTFVLDVEEKRERHRKDGKDGKDGREGREGKEGKDGKDGKEGKGWKNARKRIRSER